MKQKKKKKKSKSKIQSSNHGKCQWNKDDGIHVLTSTSASTLGLCIQHLKELSLSCIILVIDTKL